MKLLSIAILIFSFEASFAGVIGEDSRSILGPRTETERALGNATFKIGATLADARRSESTGVSVYHPRIIVTTRHSIYENETGEKSIYASVILGPEKSLAEIRFINVNLNRSVCRTDLDRCWLVLDEPIPNAQPISLEFFEGSSENIVLQVSKMFSPSQIGSNEIANVSFHDDVHSSIVMGSDGDNAADDFMDSETEASIPDHARTYGKYRSYQSCDLRDVNPSGFEVKSDCDVRKGSSGAVQAVKTSNGIRGIAMTVAMREESEDFKPYNSRTNHMVSEPFDKEDERIVNAILADMLRGNL